MLARLLKNVSSMTNILLFGPHNVNSGTREHHSAQEKPSVQN